MLREEYYRDAIVLGLQKRGIPCELEKGFEVHYEGERVGLYYVDEWVDDGKMLEIKVAPAIEPIHKAQALSYLKVADADLAIVVNCGGPSLDDERLPNFLRDKRPEFAWEPQPVAQGLVPDLVNDIRRACHRAHFGLGPSLSPQVYRRASMIELRRSELNYDYLRQLPVEYEGQLLGCQDVRLVLVVDKILLAAFALREPDDARCIALAEQLQARLRRMVLKLGLLASFYGTRVAIGPVRVKQGPSKQAR